MNMQKTKWVFFDLGSTIVDEILVYESRINYLAAQIGMSAEETAEIVRQEARASAAPIKAAAKKYGVVMPPWDQTLERLYPDAGGVLKQLSGHYHLGIIANQPAGTKSRLESWGLLPYFDVVAASAEEGCAKPDLRLFEIALEKAQCRPDEAIMVGDRIDNDVFPARQLGMKTVWIRQGMAQYHILTEVVPDMIVDSLSGLPALLLR